MSARLIPFRDDLIVAGAPDGEPFSHNEVVALRRLAQLVFAGESGEKLQCLVNQAVMHRGIARMAVEMRGEG